LDENLVKPVLRMTHLPQLYMDFAERKTTPANRKSGDKKKPARPLQSSPTSCYQPCRILYKSGHGEIKRPQKNGFIRD
jgi:hypothetical protein